MRAAVPDYVGASFADCPPGHLFGLYFPVWKDDWMIEKDQKSAALKQTLALPPHTQETLAALRDRQTLLLDALPEAARLSIEAQSTAPFATGLGMEHPLENGFAFLNPYGLAYLPGSSIKGVLRRAAEELLPSPAGGRGAGGEGACWTEEAITALFGLESEDRQKEHTRGALTFWDALPKPAKNSMGMEVMTPHYGDYYKGESTPHDSGQPIPIVFLVVPEGAAFSFHLTCDTRRLPEPLSASWQDLMHVAFEHAFDWLGFGAKTAVGYGAMKWDDQREATVRKEREERASQALQAVEAKRLDEEKKAARAGMSPVERAIQEFLDARLDKNAPEISAVIGAVKQGHMAEHKVAVAEWLRARMQAEKGQWKETSQAKKPDKDREYQNTSLVMRWLRGE
ncbi:MAG: type III-B CRISPR module RAMP protein Cmr6 [Pseudomonadota bacterium]|nr:type III-B CRISPR module RAMP protein Cmr6 [Pseudomonadota bacterium]